jgi:hypothetical protein
VILTYDICTLIAAYSTPRSRARLMRTNRTVFGYVVGAQYASMDLTVLLQHQIASDSVVSDRVVECVWWI